MDRFRLRSFVRCGIIDVTEGAMWLAAIIDSAVDVIGAVIAALAVAAAGALVVRVRSSRAKKRAVVELQLSRILADDSRFRFGLRHVRDGTDQAAERGLLMNADHWFEKADGDPTRLVVSLRYAKRLGAQFKCFAEYREMEFEQAANVLGQEEAIGAVNRGGSPRIEPCVVPASLARNGHHVRWVRQQLHRSSVTPDV